MHEMIAIRNETLVRILYEIPKDFLCMNAVPNVHQRPTLPSPAADVAPALQPGAQASGFGSRRLCGISSCCHQTTTSCIPNGHPLRPPRLVLLRLRSQELKPAGWKEAHIQSPIRPRLISIPIRPTALVILYPKLIFFRSHPDHSYSCIPNASKTGSKTQKNQTIRAQ